MNWSISIHLLGIVFWFGGALVLTRYMKIYSTLSQRGEEAHRFTKGILMGFVVGGFVIATISGLVQLGLGGVGMYMKAGWMHTKLLLYFIALVCSGLLMKEARGFCSDEPISRGMLGKLHGAFSLILLLMLILAKVKPF